MKSVILTIGAFGLVLAVAIGFYVVQEWEPVEETSPQLTGNLDEPDYQFEGNFVKVVSGDLIQAIMEVKKHPTFHLVHWMEVEGTESFILEYMPSEAKLGALGGVPDLAEDYEFYDDGGKR